MPKYWVKNYFAHGRFPEVGQKQKTERETKRKKERLMVKTMATQSRLVQNGFIYGTTRAKMTVVGA